MLLLAVALGGTVLAGCNNPSSAVVVGGAQFGQTALSSQAQTVVSEAGVDSGQVDLAGLNRRILTGDVWHQLVSAAATKAGVSVSDADVNAYLNANGRATVATALRVPQADVVSATRDVLELQKIVTGLTGGVAVTDVAVTAQCADAATVADVTRLRRLFATHPTNGPAQAQASATSYDLLTDIDVAPDGVYQAQPGQVVTINSSDTAGVQVCLITGRQERPGQMTVTQINQYTSFDDRLNAASLVLTGMPLVSQVQVNPRFGVWDPLSLQVVSAPSA